MVRGAHPGAYELTSYQNVRRINAMLEKSLNPLSIESQQFLLETARRSIESHLQDEVQPTFQLDDAVLLEKRGAFVSLHKAEKLRGCIGYLQAETPLYQTVADVAVAAATRDPRFEPVQLPEMPEIALEVSVLTPLQQVQSVDEIEVGVHGLYIKYRKQAGLLLPQVATEHSWERATFLQQTCRKAGLPSHAWHDPEVEIYGFSAQVFGEASA
jgi:AmmeMemoRadiSam system protein A